MHMRAPRWTADAFSKQGSHWCTHAMLYVTRKDPDLNIVYVSRRYMGSTAAPDGDASQPGAALLPSPHTAIVTAPFNWLSDARPDQGPAAAPLYCKVRWKHDEWRACVSHRGCLMHGLTRPLLQAPCAARCVGSMIRGMRVYLTMTIRCKAWPGPAAAPEY
eukprot:1159516-Pelagomonas_calceolata.AAC.20